MEIQVTLAVWKPVIIGPECYYINVCASVQFFIGFGEVYPEMTLPHQTHDFIPILQGSGLPASQKQ